MNGLVVNAKNLDARTLLKVKQALGEDSSSTVLVADYPHVRVRMRLSRYLSILTDGEHNRHYPVPNALRSGVRTHIW